MNKEGKLTEKDLKILALEELIEKFKAYDLNRKKYYSKALIELGSLKEYVLELEDIIKTDKVKTKIKQQAQELRYLNKKILKYKKELESLQNTRNTLYICSVK